MTILIHQSGSAIPFSLSDNAIPTAHHPVHLANSFRLLIRKSLLVICSDQNLPAIYKAPLDQSQARDPSRSGNPPPGPDRGRWSPRHRASERVIGLAVQRWRYKKSARTKEPIIRPTLKKAAAMLRSRGFIGQWQAKKKENTAVTGRRKLTTVTTLADGHGIGQALPPHANYIQEPRRACALSIKSSLSLNKETVLVPHTQGTAHSRPTS